MLRQPPADRHHQPIPTRIAIGIAAAAFGAMLAASLFLSMPGAALADSHRPNIIFIQTDDQALADLYAEMRTEAGRWVPAMPATLRQIRDRGISFDNHYITYPTCCPSRAATLSGSYNRNNGVLGNVRPDGGWDAFRTNRIYRENIAVWLERAGYRTIHIGKFLNQYGTQKEAETDVPPGWTEWQTTATEASNRLFYGYHLNVNGEIVGPFGDAGYGSAEKVDRAGCLYGAPVLNGCNHQTDAVTRRAVRQVKKSAERPQPFYLQVDYIAPHGDARSPIGPEPTPRNYSGAAKTPLPEHPGFNERFVYDKPSFIRDRIPRLTRTERGRMTTEYRRTLESLRDVDDGVRRIIRALQQTGELESSYVVFMSDNGFFRGEHRLARGKILPYEPATKVPLLIRGPGIKPGTVSQEITANIDLAPTFARLARARPRGRVDGRALIRFWRHPLLTSRRPIMLESFAGRHDLEVSDSWQKWNAGAFSNYSGIRLERYKYIRYRNGERELYDLRRDPAEMTNRYGLGKYRRVQRFLEHHLRRLEQCAGSKCRAEVKRVPAPKRSGRNRAG